jgi:hypothetical protein
MMLPSPGALDDAAMMRGNGGREQHECAGFLGGAINAAGGLSVSEGRCERRRLAPSPSLRSDGGVAGTRFKVETTSEPYTGFVRPSLGLRSRKSVALGKGEEG